MSDAHRSDPLQKSHPQRSHLRCWRKAGLDTKIGWQDLLIPNTCLDDVIVKDSASPISIMPLRPDINNPANAKRLAHMLPTILTELSSTYDVIVVDCEPIESVMNRVGGGELPMSIAAFVFDGQLLTDDQRNQAQQKLADKSPEIVAMIQNFSR